MSAVLGMVSTTFGRRFVAEALLPAAVFVVSGIMMLAWLTDADVAFQAGLGRLWEEWATILTLFLTVVIAVMMFYAPMGSALLWAAGRIRRTGEEDVVSVIRSYLRHRYGMDFDRMWPRLLAVMPADSIERLEDSGSRFRLLANMCLSCAVLYLLCLFLGLLWGVPFASRATTVCFVVVLSALALSCLGFCRWAFQSAQDWGERVEAAFDFHRWDLLKRLGYSQEPRTPEEEVQLWQGISRDICESHREGSAVTPYGSPRDGGSDIGRIPGYRVCRALRALSGIARVRLGR